MSHPIVHFEIGCRDKAKTAEFFSKLFDWKIEDEGPAARIRNGEDVGGHINALGHGLSARAVAARPAPREFAPRALMFQLSSGAPPRVADQQLLESVFAVEGAAR
ncbi:MAG TPA: hypothetical protein VK780_07240 [Thermoanaerobaculia bacterium]|jgi:hypothetical protein|nr:hypothetical protein [Thermoanaerobaculia bacterium]